MTRMTGGSASVERKIGRAISCPNGDNERPYGRCYGQVCGVSYPCTQRVQEKEHEKTPAVTKKDYYKNGNRVAHNARKVRCAETGTVFLSLKEAAIFAGVSAAVFRKKFTRGKGKATFGSYTFEAVD